MLYEKEHPIKLVLADDETIFRSRFKSMLLAQKGHSVQVVSEATTGTELLNSIEKHAPHIVITSPFLPGTDSWEAIKLIKLTNNTIRIIMLTKACEEALILNMFSLGINGYLTKQSDQGEIFQAMNTVVNGGHHICQSASKKFARVLSKFMNAENNSVSPIQFSEKEVLIMKLICLGFVTKEIACKTGLKVRTIEDYRKRIQLKIGARSAVGIVQYAYKNGIINGQDY